MTADEKIQMCLNCQKPYCTDCLSGTERRTNRGRIAYPVIAENGKHIKRFDSICEAAMFTGKCLDSMRKAIKSGELRYGYYWRYDK